MLRFMNRSFMVGLLCLTGGIGQAMASVIYDNGGPDQNSGNEMTAWIQAENFTLSTDATITDVHFWSLEASGAYQGSIHWQIYDDNMGVPGIVLAGGGASPTRTATGIVNVFGFLDEFEYDFVIPGFNALGGVVYHLALHNGPLTTTTRAEFYWETTSAVHPLTGNEQIAPFGFGNWSGNSQEHAFNLTNDAAAVPEPGSLTLLGMGAFGLVAGAIRRRRQQAA